jgi:hypothetical protein
MLQIKSGDNDQLNVDQLVENINDLILHRNFTLISRFDKTSQLSSDFGFKRISKFIINLIIVMFIDIFYFNLLIILFITI